MKESDLRYQRLTFAVTFLALGVVLVGAVWEGKPYLEWTQDEAIAVLTDSPWASCALVRSISEPPKIEVILPPLKLELLTTQGKTKKQE